MNPTVPRAGKVCAYVGCRRLFRPITNYRRSKYCSRQCAVDARPRLARVMAGRKGGINSGVLRRAESLGVIQRRIEGLAPSAVFLLGRRYGKADLGNRVKTARREGFSEGFEAGYQEALRQQQIRRPA